MGLEKFLKHTEKLENKQERLLKLQEKLIKEMGYDKIKALRKAETIVFRPKQLEALKLNAQRDVGLRPSLNFFFENEDDVRLIAKYFTVSYASSGVESGQLLIDLLKMLEEINNGK